jgi:predicted ATPase
MIRSLYIDNFKSLVHFRLPMVPHRLGRFVCLVGLNGAGKSTVLQALDFLAHLPGGNLPMWLERREWRASDLTSRLLKRQLIRFSVEFEFAALGRVTWEGAFNTVLMRCTSETITTAGQVVLRSADQVLTVQQPVERGTSAPEVLNLRSLKFEGSALSLLKPERQPSGVAAVFAALAAFKSLDMLSPQAMRQRAKDASDIGYGGEHLSAYLHGLKKEQRDAVLGEMQQFYPHLGEVTTQALRAGWKDLLLKERYTDTTGRPLALETRARHVSDGMLRILAVLAQIHQSDGPAAVGDAPSIPSAPDICPLASVLFDEIENGINPELMGRLVARLLQARAQVFVTTHNPLLLNYLPDEVAQEAVIFLYRTPAGLTRAARLFDLPRMAHKLGLLGPGEVYADTDLVTLQHEADQMRLQDVRQQLQTLHARLPTLQPHERELVEALKVELALRDGAP